MSTRVHIVLPDDMLAELDQVAGRRHRSDFIAEAIREKLQRLQKGHTTAESINAIPLDDIPVWNSLEEVTAWLRASRQRDVERLTTT